MDRRPEESGAALVLVLVLVAVLAAAAVEALRQAQVELAASRAHAYRAQAGELLESGLRLACEVLAQDPPRADHQHEAWAEFFEAGNPRGVGALGLQSGQLQGRLWPLNARFPLGALGSAAGRQALERLLAGPAVGLAPDRAQAMAAALADWVDADDKGEFEAAAYAQAGLAYVPTNGAMASLGEARLVLGMADDLWQGGNGRPGLRTLLAVGADVRVNVNAAGAAVLDALYGEGTAAALLAFRADPANAGALDNAGWPGQVLGREPAAASLTSAASQEFQLELRARCGGVERGLHAVLRRAGGRQTGVEVLRLEMD